MTFWSTRTLPAVLAAAVFVSKSCDAGVWSSDPVIGVAGVFSTNPALLYVPHSAESRAAVLLDAPTTYNGDAFAFTALPRFRVGNSQGYSSLTSNYEHLDLKGEYDTDLDTYSLSGSLARDSSVYYNYTLNGSTGVRRDSSAEDANWSHRFSERLSFDLDANDSRVRYGRATGPATLIDYSYRVLNPTLSWAESEKGKLMLSGGANFYNSLDHANHSTTLNLQLGFTRQLTEIWSLTAYAGDSRSSNRSEFTRQVLVFTPQGLEVVSIPEEAKSSSNATVFAVNLSRQAQASLLTVAASRQLVPSGFAFLSRQQTYELSVSHPYSDRSTVSAAVRLVKSQDPSFQGVYFNRTVRAANLSSQWHVSEHWVMTATAAHVSNDTGRTSASTEITLQISRQFDHIKY